MKWGILGCASIAEKAIIPAIKSVETNSLIAIASRNLEKAEGFAKLFNCKPVLGYENLLSLPEIEAVYIPLPTGMHFEWVMKALEAGKHVLVEKSAAENFDQAQKMVALARAKKLALVENFQFQFHNQHQYVFNLLKEKAIGDIRCFRSSFGFPPFSTDSNIRYKKELGGGALLDAGAYVLKATSFILGENFEVKSSFLKMNQEYDVDWYGGAFLVDQENQIFSEVAFGFDNFYQCNYEIWGSKGKITCTRAFTAKPDYAPEIILETNGNMEIIKLKKDNHFLNMINHFTQSIEDKSFEKDYERILVQANLVQEVLDKNAI